MQWDVVLSYEKTSHLQNQTRNNQGSSRGGEEKMLKKKIILISNSAGKMLKVIATQRTSWTALVSKISAALSAVTCVWQKQHLCIIWTVCFIIKYHLSLHLNLFSTSVRSGLNKALKTNSKTFTDHWLNMYIYHLSPCFKIFLCFFATPWLRTVKMQALRGFIKLIF